MIDPSWDARLRGERFFALAKHTHLTDHLAAYAAAIDHRLGARPHGRDAEWQAIVNQIEPSSGSTSIADQPSLKSLLQSLHPWRKGPFVINDLVIDSEWRSDLKWERLKDAIQSLHGRTVLDVGCGNGFYLSKMVDEGAALALGIDPTRLFLYQFEAIAQLTGLVGAAILPLKDEDLPLVQLFDTVFSMGVIYHRRQPLQHLACLKAVMRPQAELILETLIVTDEDRYPEGLIPEDRYAKMRNVWCVPTLSQTLRWLKEAGFSNPRVIDVTSTTRAEQRRTEWMTFESLDDFLDPHDLERTIEGYPAPVRGIFIADA